MMKKFLLWAAVCCCAVLGAAPVKIIDLSWSNPTVAFLQKNLAQMEAYSPLDGITIRVRGNMVTTREGKKIYAGTALWTSAKIEYKSFAKEIAILKKLPFKKFTDNFFYSTTYHYDIDWYDDAQWGQCAANFGVAARVCRAAGLKGMLFDIEEYGKRFWDYNQTSRKLDYKSTCKIAYKRGQQWGREVFRNYPDIVLFMPFVFSMHMGNLSASFINGILSVMPPTARIIEGFEGEGYSASWPEDYPLITVKFYHNANAKALPSTRAKYLSQVELAPAFYIDAVVRRKAEAKKACGGTINFMRRNLSAAAKEAKTYIWFYGEQGAWWKNSPHRKVKKTWEEQVPGITQAIRETVRPRLVFKKENLLKNPQLKDQPPRTRNGWNSWQRDTDPKKRGTITIGGGKVVFKNVLNGCVSQSLAVKPGEYYLFQFRGTNRSTGYAHGFVAFKDKNRKWMASCIHIKVPLPATGKIEDVSTLITIPRGAYTASVQLSAGGQNKGNSGEVIFTGAQFLKY